jgi:hypothetical protein
MFASRVIVDTEGSSRPFELGPDWAVRVETYIRQLDGLTRTLVTLIGPGEASLAVGGGRKFYVVYATLDGTVFYSLVNPDGDATEREIVAGGQPAAYPTRYLVPVDDALRAALSFAESGRLAAELPWSAN